MRPQPGSRNDRTDKDLRQGDARASHHIPTDNCRTDPGLTAVIEAWDRLPEAIRAGIMAIVKAASKEAT
jgi:hypothetical protein